MPFQHGKQTVVKLADLTGALQDISALVKHAKFAYKTDRPPTQTFGKFGEKHEITGLRELTIGLDGFIVHTGTTKLHGKLAKILQDQYVLSADLLKGSIKRKIKIEETATFGDFWKRRSTAAKGLMSCDVSFNGLFDSAVGQVDAVYRAAVGVDPPGQNVISLGLNGFTIGNLVELIQAVQVSYDIDSAEEKLVDVAGNYVSDEQFDVGVSLHDLVAETTAGTVTYAGVDWTDVTTTGGWVAHFHITAFSGWTNATLKIQDSADNVTFADLAGSTSNVFTGVGSQRIEGAFGSTVRRYVRASVTFTGVSGSMTFAVTFSRRAYVTVTPGTHKHFCGLLTYGMPNYAGSLGANSAFEFGPEGSAVGKRRFTGGSQNGYTGGLVLPDYTANFDENGLSTYALTLMSDGAILENTY